MDQDTPEITFNLDPPPQEQSQAEPQQEDLSLASPFLNNIPASDRAVVGRYIKDWDAGVTKKFQSYSDRIKRYEALGPEDELTQYVNFANNFKANPEGVFRLMWEGLQEQYGENFETELLRILAVEQAMNDYEYQGPEQQEESDPNELFQNNVTQELEELRAWKEQLETSQQEAEEFAQLDQVLKAMHQRWGDFDDDYILLRLGNHGNIEKAYEDWQNMISRSGGSSQRQAPKVMGGQGGVPVDNVDVAKLRGKDRRAAITNILAASE